MAVTIAWHRTVGRGGKGLNGGAGAHPLVVISKAGPVEHMHHGLKAEDGRLAQLAVVRQRQYFGCQLDGLVCLRPGKLLLPCLPWNTSCFIYQA